MAHSQSLDRPTAAQTFHALLLEHASVRASRPAIREKDLGIWQTLSWANVAECVRLLAHGLATLGIIPSKHVAAIGENRSRLHIAMMAAQALGTIPVPLYQDAVAQEMVYVLQDAEISVVIVEDQEQVDKMLEVHAMSRAQACDLCRPTRHAQLLRRPAAILGNAGENRTSARTGQPRFLPAGRAPCSPTTRSRCTTPSAPRASPRVSC